MPPPVVIAANPYEAELCRKALAPTGISVACAEDREHVVRLVSQARPLVVVLADGWVAGPSLELIGELRALIQSVPLFLIADREGPFANESAAARAGATQLFLRPIEIDSLADAIEKLAVEDELHNEVSEQLDGAVLKGPHSAPADVELEADFDDEWSSPPVARQPTEVLAADAPGGTGPAGFETQPSSFIPSAGPTAPPDAATPPFPSVAGDLGPPPPTAALGGPARTRELVLRADDVLAEAAGLHIQTLAQDDFVRPTNGGAVPPSMDGATDDEWRKLEDRGTLARRLHQELSEAERRLFPDAAPASSSYEYDDALGDIDLDALGIDTLPGIAADVVERNVPRERLIPDAPTREDGAAPGTPPRAEVAPLEPATPAVEEEGALAETDVAELLAGLHATGWSGRLTLRRDEAEKAIFFDGGQPVFATSSALHDRLADLLFREGKITREQQKKARDLETGRAAAARFVELGLLKPREVFSTLRRHVEEILYSCFAWQDGRYRLTAEQAPPEDKLKLSGHVWALIAEGVRRKYGLERLVERLGPSETVLTPTVLLDRALVDCELLPAERLAADLIDGERSLGEIAMTASGMKGAGLSEPSLYALAFTLVAVGAARLDEEPGAARITASSSAPTSPAARERRAVRREDASELPADRAVDRERLLAKRAQVLDGDYFQILGVDRHASTHEIERAFARQRADFAPERFGSDLRAELGEALDEIYEVLDEARQLLLDERMRAAYREHLVQVE